MAVPARGLPADRRTVYGYFGAWRDNGTRQRLHDRLRDQVRCAARRDPRPTAAVIDSQSVKAADTVPKATRGWDNAKKVNGRYLVRHIAVDAMGLVLAVVITAASVQDRDAARAVAVEPAPCLPEGRSDLGRRRIRRRQARRLGHRHENHRRGRGQARPACLRSPAAQMGRRADFRLDQQAPPHCPGLRAPTRQPRSHDLVGHDRSDDSPPGPGHRFITRSLRTSRGWFGGPRWPRRWRRGRLLLCVARVVPGFRVRGRCRRSRPRRRRSPRSVPTRLRPGR